MTGKITDNLGRSSGLVKAVAAGRTGTVDWCTTAKTSPLTVESGKGYFINTNGGAVTVTLPSSPSAGDIVSLKDYAGTWATACKSVTLGRGGSKINGVCADTTLETANKSITIVYVDATKGWQDIQDSDSAITGVVNLTATGGNAVVTCGDYKTHIFTANGCFAVSAISTTASDNNVDYVVIGSGGGGQAVIAGGGGAGGFRMSNNIGLGSPVTSPLANPTGITVSATTYPIVVGAAGAAGDACGGNVSSFGPISSAGGGTSGTGANTNGNPGGSGSGGNWRDAGGTSTGGSGNTPPVSPAQGTNGGNNTPNNTSGGGGGAAAAGTDNGQTGGIGSYIADGFVGPTAPSYGTPGPVSNTRYFAGGGGGANRSGNSSGGTGGGGAGGGYSPGNDGTAGTTNTGGGGGSGGPANGAGGSGIVMIRYKYQ